MIKKEWSFMSFILVSVDGRGSAFQGDEFMFANYMALSQTERVDQTEFVRWFITKGKGWPYCSLRETHFSRLLLRCLKLWNQGLA